VRRPLDGQLREGRPGLSPANRRAAYGAAGPASWLGPIDIIRQQRRSMSGSTDKPEGRRVSRGSGARKATKPDAASQRGVSRLIDERIRSLGDWRGETLAEVRRLIHEAAPDIVEDCKWIKPTNRSGVPVWSHAGIVCTGEAYKQMVKLTFARGASLDD